MSQRFVVDRFDSDPGFSELTSSMARCITAMMGLPAASTLEEIFSNRALCEQLQTDHALRGRIYKTLPALASVQQFCVSNAHVLGALTKLSGFSSDSFVALNVNVRMDFPSKTLQDAHNLDVHQDFHYTNPFVTAKNSFVLWMPLISLDPATGGLFFDDSLEGVDGAVAHVPIHRTISQAPHWLIPESIRKTRVFGEKYLRKGEFMVFDMRHMHASQRNTHAHYPRLTLQCRYTSYLEEGFLAYQSALPVAAA